jgi:hypothetical protein
LEPQVSFHRLVVHDLADPPRRLMEEELEWLLRRRGERSLVTIEYVSDERVVTGDGTGSMLPEFDPTTKRRSVQL